MTMLMQSAITSKVDLAKYTTLRVGGAAEEFARPQSEAELLELLEQLQRRQAPYRILGKGSNVFASDDGVPGLVIHNTNACRQLSIKGRYIKVGSSVPLQRLINDAARAGLGGIEYLYSVPGNVGGAIYMNAGRGRAYRASISDVVYSVEVFDKGRVVSIPRRHCRFGYRSSIFHERQDLVILSATLRLPYRRPEDVRRCVDERMALVRRTQDTSLPNAGSVFKEGCSLSQELKGVRRGKARFSELTANWIVIEENCSSTDVWRLLEVAFCEHARRGLALPLLEWNIW